MISVRLKLNKYKEYLNALKSKNGMFINKVIEVITPMNKAHILSF